MSRVALCLVLLSGCGAGPTFSRGVFRDGDVVFRIGDLGGDWRRVEVAGNDLAFHSRTVAGVVAINGDCDRDNDPPLRQLLMQLLIGFTEREFLTEEAIPLDGREAMHAIVRARIDGVPMLLDLFVLKKDECLYDFSYVAPPGEFERARGDYEAFVRGFAAPMRRQR
ncbi:MAG: hypothetical protein HYY06_27795 [Deltaproteobacteria bacterium]|nr:hypothetical protein [Deltaproteobacteria bacterium]